MSLNVVCTCQCAGSAQPNVRAVTLLPHPADLPGTDFYYRYLMGRELANFCVALGFVLFAPVLQRDRKFAPVFQRDPKFMPHDLADANLLAPRANASCNANVNLLVLAIGSFV